MEFKEAIKQYKRMCEYYTKKGQKNCDGCSYCAMSCENNGGEYCINYLTENEEEAENIIKKFVEEHSMKTNIEKFIEVFGTEYVPSPSNHSGVTSWWNKEFKGKEDCIDKEKILNCIEEMKEEQKFYTDETQSGAYAYHAYSDCIDIIKSYLLNNEVNDDD